MAARQLTALAVRNAKPRLRKGRPERTEYPAGGGLYLVVQPSGGKGWAFRYRFNGTPRKLTLLGTLTLAEARVRAAEARLELEQGLDPARRRVEGAPSRDDDRVEAMAKAFVALHAKRKTRASTVAQTVDILDRIVLPAWRGRSVHDIRRRDVIALAEHIAIDRPYMANRTLGVLSKWFAWMVARDVLEVSPVAGVERPHQEQSRDRILTDTELRALWLARDGDSVFSAFFRILALTGQRRGEVAGMRWSEIDAARRLWSLPAARAKNGHAHTIPLSTQAWAVLASLPRVCDFVFTYDGARPISGFAKPKSALAERAKVSNWRLHDVRRTTASGLQKLGVTVPVIERALNHVSGSFRGVAGVYLQHDYADEVRIALQKWADHVERLAGGKPAKVLSLRGRK